MCGGVDAITGVSATAATATATATPTPTPDLEDAALRRMWNLGGLNQDVDADSTVYYNPATTTLAAPPMPEVPLPLKTQFAPQGPVLLQTLELAWAPGGVVPCVCGTVCIAEVAPGSVGALLMTRRNMIRVRRALQKAGIVRASPCLASLTDVSMPCLCSGLGSDPDLFRSLFAFATKYGNTPAITQPNPAELVAFLNTVYVRETLDNIQHAVAAEAMANYARAEGGRAYLQPRPLPDSLVFDPVLTAQERGDAFCERELHDPVSTALRRVQLSTLVGIPGL